MMMESFSTKPLVTENPVTETPKMAYEISSLPSGIKTHFQVVREPGIKGQARYRCWKCSHEFECSGRNRLVHHVTGLCLDGTPSKHILKCPNPHLPLKEAVIAKIFRDLPQKELRESLKRKKEKEEAEDEITFNPKQQKISNDVSPSPNELKYYPPDRTLEILNLLQIMCPQQVQLAIIIEKLQRGTSSETPSNQALSTSLAMALRNSDALGSGGIANGIGLLPYVQFRVPELPIQQQPQPRHILYPPSRNVLYPQPSNVLYPQPNNVLYPQPQPNNFLYPPNNTLYPPAIPLSSNYSYFMNKM